MKSETAIVKVAWYTKFDKAIRFKDLELMANNVFADTNFRLHICNLDNGSYTAYRLTVDNYYPGFKLCNSLDSRQMAAFIQGLHIGLAHTPMDLLDPRENLVPPRYKL